MGRVLPISEGCPAVKQKKQHINAHLKTIKFQTITSVWLRINMALPIWIALKNNNTTAESEWLEITLAILTKGIVNIHLFWFISAGH